jgi:nucleoside-diphosphate-sugar epimerase
MKIVVTGALGHIGSALIRNGFLLANVDEIVLIDDLSTQRYSSLFDLHGPTKYRFLQGDVTARLDKEVLAGADVVIHLAGITDPVGSVHEPAELFGNNLRITRHVADTCAEAGVPVIFSSSTSVYTPTQAMVDESSSELDPASPYAQCKLLEEDYVLRRTGPGGSLVFRFGTIFGASSGMRFHTAVNKFCWQAATGVPIEVWSTAMDQIRPYLAVSDASAAIARATVEGIFPGGIINAVTCNVTVREVLDAIQVCGTSPQVKLIDSPIMNALSFSASTDAARALGFTFKGDLQSGVRETMTILGHLGK